MGLNMDQIHMPTVPAGPTTVSGVQDGSGDPVKSLTELIAEKDRLESELSALSSVLDSHGVNMNTTLTTFDGYPRDDLDIAQIRTTRARIIHLRNDYKSLMSKIEAGLHAHYATAKDAGNGTTPALPARAGTSTSTPSGSLEAPFAKVNSIVAGSPADSAGLKAGDEIRRFGSVTWLNHEKLSRVAQTVQNNEGGGIVVKVKRKGIEQDTMEEFQVELTPRRDWGGRGLLGCHLVPL